MEPMEVDEAGDGVAELPYIELDELCAYIVRNVSGLVGESDETLISGPLSIASDSLSTFIKDQQSPIFVINRLVQSDDESDKPSVCYTAINEMHYNKDQMLAVIFCQERTCCSCRQTALRTAWSHFVSI
jgi:hypothetical protein